MMQEQKYFSIHLLLLLHKRLKYSRETIRCVFKWIMTLILQKERERVCEHIYKIVTYVLSVISSSCHLGLCDEAFEKREKEKKKHTQNDENRKISPLFMAPRNHTHNLHTNRTKKNGILLIYYDYVRFF